MKRRLKIFRSRQLLALTAAAFAFLAVTPEISAQTVSGQTRKPADAQVETIFEPGKAKSRAAQSSRQPEMGQNPQKAKRGQDSQKPVGVKVVDVTEMIPKPIVNGSPEFVLDSLLYEESKSLRATPRGETAASEASPSLTTMLRVFSAPLGITLSQSGTPDIAAYLNTTFKYGRAGIQKAKHSFRRQRPYQYFGQPSGIPKKERANDFTSYPSGHSLRGWICAMALSAIAPEYTGALFKAGYEFGQSRVIVGYHFQSDVDAGRSAASISYSVLSGDRKWQKLQKKARKELEKELRKAGKE